MGVCTSCKKARLFVEVAVLGDSWCVVSIMTEVLIILISPARGVDCKWGNKPSHTY